MNDIWPAFLPFGVFIAWLILMTMRRRMACPNCETPLSRIQSPLTKTRRQWWEGGYVCPSCGCESDRAGNRVPAGTAPQRRSIVIGIVLLALLAILVILALVLVAAIVYR